MPLSPPKFPSAKNVGLVVREVNKGVYRDRDLDASTEGGTVDFTAAIGVSLGVILKKNQPKPYTRKSFTFKLLLVCTSKGRQSLLWFQEPKQVDAAVKRLLARLSELAAHFAKPYLLSVDGVIDYFMAEVGGGRVGNEHIGKNGVPALAFPNLGEHDENHAAILADPELFRVLENYWGGNDADDPEDLDELVELNEQLAFEDGSDDQAESENLAMDVDGDAAEETVQDEQAALQSTTDEFNEYAEAIKAKKSCVDAPKEATNFVELAQIDSTRDIDLLVEAAIAKQMIETADDKENSDPKAKVDADAQARMAQALLPDAKLFGDATRKPMVQTTLDAPALPDGNTDDDGDVVMLTPPEDLEPFELQPYEGKKTALHGKYTVAPGTPICHDVFGPGDVVRKGMPGSVVCSFEDATLAPNPRAVTHGHIVPKDAVPPPPPLVTLTDVDGGSAHKSSYYGVGTVVNVSGPDFTKRVGVVVATADSNAPIASYRVVCDPPHRHLLEFSADEALMSEVKEPNCLYARADAEEIFAERGVPLNLKDDSLNVSTVAGDARVPVLAVVNSRGLSTAAQAEIGSSMVALLGGVEVATVHGGSTIRNGDAIAVLRNDGTTDYFGIVYAITVPVETSGMNMQGAKLLIARSKIMKRNKWTPALALVNSKGTEKVTDKLDAFIFKSLAIIDSMREMVIVKVDDYFTETTLPMASKLDLLYGSSAMAQMDIAAKNANFFSGIADAVPHVTLFSRQCDFSRNFVTPFLVNTAGTSPLSGHTAGHAELVYRQGLWSVQTNIVKAYSALGSELVSSTLVAADGDFRAGVKTIFSVLIFCGFAPSDKARAKAELDFLPALESKAAATKRSDDWKADSMLCDKSLAAGRAKRGGKKKQGKADATEKRLRSPAAPTSPPAEKVIRPYSDSSSDSDSSYDDGKSPEHKVAKQAAYKKPQDAAKPAIAAKKAAAAAAEPAAAEKAADGKKAAAAEKAAAAKKSAAAKKAAEKAAAEKAAAEKAEAEKAAAEKAAAEAEEAKNLGAAARKKAAAAAAAAEKKAAMAQKTAESAALMAASRNIDFGSTPINPKPPAVDPATDARLVQLQEKVSVMMEAQKESAELLKRQLARAADRSPSPQPSTVSQGSSAATAEVFLSSLSTLSKDLTKDLVSAHTTLNDKHERLADFFKNAYEAEVTSRKEMQADLIAATAVATANEAQVKGLEVALIEVRHQNEYLTKLTEALRAEQLAMVEKVMTQLARW